MSRTLLLTPNTAFARRVAAATPPSGRNGLCGVKEQDLALEPATLAARLVGQGVEVVCIGPDVATATMLELARSFDRDHPEVSVVLVAEATDELQQWAMRAGVREVLSPQCEPAEVHRALDRAREVSERRRHLASAAPTIEPKRGRVITVLSAKGGSGKTLLATNLAVGLAGGTSDVAIVDLDVHFGDVGAALGLQPEHTMTDVISGAQAIDKTVLKIFLTRHDSGLFVLCAPDTPGKGDEVDSGHVERVLSLLQDDFEAVVVDTAAGLDEITLAAVEASTDLVLACTKDVASVRCLRKEIDALDQLGMTTQRRHFVLNRCDAKVGLDTADIEAVVGMKVAFAIPSARAVPLSMNLGLPVLLSEPRSAPSRRIRRLVAELAGAGSPRRGVRRLTEGWGR